MCYIKIVEWLPQSLESLSGWWFQPLWKIWVSSVGMIIPNILWKHNPNVPNHQPVANSEHCHVWHTKFDSRNIPGTTGWFQMSNPSACLWTAVNTIEIHWKHDTNHHTSILLLWTSLHFITTSLSNPILFHNSLTLKNQYHPVPQISWDHPWGRDTNRLTHSHMKAESQPPRSPVGWTVLIFLVSWCPKHHWFLYIASWIHNFFHAVS
jgi:hypothetical protein